MAKNLLVLGAGASYSYGFPLARDLVDEICFDGTRFGTNVLNRVLQINQDAFETFKYRLRLADPPSIDWYAQQLTKPDEFLLAKGLIAYLIAHREGPTAVARKDDPKHPQHWMRLLGNVLIGAQLEDFPQRDVAIITFNYDRSLEQYFLLRLFETFKDRHELDEVLTAFRRLEIVHVYGDLGDLPNLGPNIRAFEPITGSDQLAIALKSMHLLPELLSDPNLGARKRAVELMALAGHSVTFLGFAYSPENLRALGLPDSLVSNANFLGTAFGVPLGGPRDAIALRFKMIGVNQNIRFLTDPATNAYDIYDSILMHPDWILGPPKPAIG